MFVYVKLELFYRDEWVKTSVSKNTKPVKTYLKRLAAAEMFLSSNTLKTNSD